MILTLGKVFQLMPTKQQGGLAKQEAPRKDESTGSYRAVFKNVPFLLIWVAQLISQIAFNAGNYGLITIVTEVTGSAIMVGIAMICFTLPAIPFSLLAGVYVDYLNKRSVLWVTNAWRAVISFLTVIALILFPTTVTFLFILTVLNSIVTQFFMPSEAASIPMLVGKKNLVQALSLFNITLNAAQAIGFLILGRVIEGLFKTFTVHLGAISITLSPHDMLFFVIGVSYIVCIFLILAIPSRKLHAVEQAERELPKSPGKEMWSIVERDIIGAWKFVRTDKRLLASILQVTFVSVLLLMIGELAGPFVQKVLLLPVNDLSLIFAPAGVGLVLGGICMPFLTKRIGKVASIRWGAILTALGLIILPLSQSLNQVSSFFHHWSLFIVGAAAFVLGVSLDMVNIPAQTVMQERSPEDERARIISFEFMLTHAGSIPALLIAGFLADVIGLPIIMYVTGGIILVFLWWTSHHSHHPTHQATPQAH